MTDEKKKCPSCGKRKSLDQFNKGVYHCRACQKKYAHAYYEKNKKKVLKRNADWYKKHPERKQEIVNASRKKKVAEGRAAIKLLREAVKKGARFSSGTWLKRASVLLQKIDAGVKK